MVVYLIWLLHIQRAGESREDLDLLAGRVLDLITLLRRITIEMDCEQEYEVRLRRDWMEITE